MHAGSSPIPQLKFVLLLSLGICFHAGTQDSSLVNSCLEDFAIVLDT